MGVLKWGPVRGAVLVVPVVGRPVAVEVAVPGGPRPGPSGVAGVFAAGAAVGVCAAQEPGAALLALAAAVVAEVVSECRR